MPAAIMRDAGARDPIGALDRGLLARPLEFILADHLRQRTLCRLLDRFADAPALDRELARAAAEHLRRDLAIHVLDEEEDLFPLLRRRARPADDIERVLGLLSREHSEDDRLAETIAAGLGAVLDRGASSLDETLRAALRSFAERQRRHLAVENAIVMPLAEARLTPKDREGARPAHGGAPRAAPPHGRSSMIDELFDRNAAWALDKTEREPGYFRRLAAQQAPRFLWIGCSDSRVPANEIVGLDPGELFVHRNVANVMHTGDLNLLSVLEFAVGTLKVEHIIVCGHYGCGGVRRALAGRGGALVDHWLAPIADLHARERARFDRIEDEEARVNLLCELNVEMQVARVAATPILQSAWREGRAIEVHGWIYGLKDGLLRDLGVTRGGIEAPHAAARDIVDPNPVDDWSDAVRLGAIHLLEAGCGCAAPRWRSSAQLEAAQ